MTALKASGVEGAFLRSASFSFNIFYKTAVAMISCPECSASISERAVQCPSCGARLRTPKSRVVAILLAFFLGGFGAQEFYTGRIGRGVVLALFCWTFIPALIGIVQMIRFLLMTDEVFGAYASK